MWINLILLFICINFAIGMVTGVEGSPMYVVQQVGECSPFPIYGEDHILLELYQNELLYKSLDL